mgnify:CR=1 FL=1
MSSPQSTPTFTRRAGAYALDVLICAVAIQLGQWALFFTWGDPRAQLDGGLQWFAYMWLSVSAPVYVYFAWAESSAGGATIGKRAASLVVRDGYGARVSFARALWRTFVKLAPWDLTHLVLCFPAPPWDGGPDFELRRGIFAVYALLALDLAAALMTRRQQAFHDLLAGTLVLKV